MSKKYLKGLAEYGLQVFLRSGNYAYGQNASLSAGNGSGSYVIDSAPEAAPVPRELTKKTFLGGGNKPLSVAYIGKTGYDSFAVRLNEFDDSLMALLSANAVNTTTNSRWRFKTGSVASGSIPNAGILLSYESTDDYGDGLLYSHLVYPKAQLFFDIASDGGSLVADLRISPSESEYGLTGESMSDLAGVAKADHYFFDTPNPVHLYTFISDGTETDFVVPYTPVSSTIALANTPNHFVRNGTPQALTSMTTATKTAVMATAGNSGDKNVLIYETDFTT